MLSLHAAVAGRVEKPRKALCADAHGFSLHAAVLLASDQRKELERRCRTITRQALANELLSRDGQGQVVLRLKSRLTTSTPIVEMEHQIRQLRTARVQHDGIVIDHQAIGQHLRVKVLHAPPGTLSSAAQSLSSSKIG